MDTRKKLTTASNKSRKKSDKKDIYIEKLYKLIDTYPDLTDEYLIPPNRHTDISNSYNIELFNSNEKLKIKDKVIRELKFVSGDRTNSFLRITLEDNSKIYKVVNNSSKNLENILTKLGGINESMVFYDQHGMDPHSESFWTKSGYTKQVIASYTDVHINMLAEVGKLVRSDQSYTFIEFGCGDGKLLNAAVEQTKKIAPQTKGIGFDLHPGITKENTFNQATEIPDVSFNIGDTTKATELIKKHDLLKDKSDVKTIVLLSGSNNRHVLKGTYESLNVIHQLYLLADYVVWSGLSTPLVTKNMVKGDYRVILKNFTSKNASISNTFMLYILEKKSLSEKIDKIIKKIDKGKTQIDLSYMADPVEVLKNINTSYKEKVFSIKLNNCYIPDKKSLDNLVQELKQFPFLKSIYLDYRSSWTPYLVDLIKKSDSSALIKCEIYMQNWHDTFEIPPYKATGTEKFFAQRGHHLFLPKTTPSFTTASTVFKKLDDCNKSVQTQSDEDNKTLLTFIAIMTKQWCSYDESLLIHLIDKVTHQFKIKFDPLDSTYDKGIVILDKIMNDKDLRHQLNVEFGKVYEVYRPRNEEDSIWSTKWHNLSIKDADLLMTKIFPPVEPKGPSRTP